MILGSFFGRIHPVIAFDSQFEYQVGLLFDNGGISDRSAGRMMSAIRIQPCMQFNTPFVGFTDPEFKRVIVWFRSFPFNTSQIV
jgi:hypothetical protein